MAMFNKLLLVALPAVAFAGVLRNTQAHDVVDYSQDCFTKRPRRASLLQQDKIPGAGIEGIDDFEAYETVLKDGFMGVDCVKDYMYYRGDKFGDNKHDYKLGPVSDVSIVHYDAHVAREDREEMTQKVCFEFCRTVPNMHFFGLVNGRGCYCTPYYKPMESDSSQCDATCPGDSTLMCGGKSKSSVFSMHMCASTGKDLADAAGDAGKMQSDGAKLAKDAKDFSNGLQKEAVSLQKIFGAVGDSGATNTMQAAKVRAGELLHQAEDANKVADKLGALVKDAKALKDFTDPDTVTRAERTMEAMDAAMAEGKDAFEGLDGELSGTELDDEDAAGDAAEQYYNVMYFVDQDSSDLPSTCSGDIIRVVVGSEDSCATACDNDPQNCVGYQLFESGDSNMCALLSNFNTGFYYTGCGGGELSFLQVKGAPFQATCFAKFSKFEGTSLKPDPSGKCDNCFKELTKADRCYK